MLAEDQGFSSPVPPPAALWCLLSAPFHPQTYPSSRRALSPSKLSPSFPSPRRLRRTRPPSTPRSPRRPQAPSKYPYGHNLRRIPQAEKPPNRKILSTLKDEIAKLVAEGDLSLPEKDATWVRLASEIHGGRSAGELWKYWSTTTRNRKWAFASSRPARSCVEGI